MGRFAKDAEFHSGKIKHFYDHAGTAGYSQAKHHYDKLADLRVRAAKSKNDKDDATVIKVSIDAATPLMEEMKRREGGGPAKPPG